MDWIGLAPVIAALVGPMLTIVALAFWRYTDNTQEEFRIITGKFDALNKFLTDNLMEMKGEIGELKGQAPTRTHTSS